MYAFVGGREGDDLKEGGLLSRKCYITVRVILNCTTVKELYFKVTQLKLRGLSLEMFSEIFKPTRGLITFSPVWV